MIIARIFVVFFIFSSLALPAAKLDSNYIFRFNTNATIRIGGFHRNLKFTMNPNENYNRSYSPNLNYSIGGGFSIKDILVQGYLPIPFTNRNVMKYGKTKYVDLQINLFQRQYGGHVFYRSFKGLNVSQSFNFFDRIMHVSPYIAKDNIGITMYGGEGYLVFNSAKFSMPAVSKYTERQKKSAGSMLVLLDVTSYKFEDDSIYDPLTPIESVMPESLWQTGTMLSSNLMAGYIYTFVNQKNFFISPLIYFGPGIIKKDVSINSSNISEIDLIVRGNLRLRSGYNGNKFFAGVLVEGSFNWMPNEIASNQLSIFTIQAIAGYRLNALKSIFKN